MARGMSRDVQIQLDALAQLSGLARQGSRELLDAGAKAGRELTIRRIGQGLALERSYIARHLRATSAVQKGDSWEARIQATRRGVLLTRFPYRQLRAANRSKSGTKRAGISGEIVRGRRYTQPRFFAIPKLRGSGATGIAVRTGKGRNAYKVLRGPSVSQAFQLHRTDLSDELQRELAQQYVQRVRAIYSATAGDDPELVFLE
ncbi:hypothetical protein [Alloalcanivorax xenomutans]|uniref:hypothetical protein n=1 Tax=Alloalcanivorax xenomutans TaxID=1094342 RepID=UPI001F2A2067|nr:hypothetical protein [Alloalcanivorax xenomutans]MCE7521960.1 hypothetical protein [Alloalcanivorax xenomutans]